MDGVSHLIDAFFLLFQSTQNLAHVAVRGVFLANLGGLVGDSYRLFGLLSLPLGFIKSSSEASAGAVDEVNAIVLSLRQLVLRHLVNSRFIFLLS